MTDERVFYCDGRWFIARTELTFERHSGDIREIRGENESLYPAGHPECERLFGLMAHAVVIR